MMEDYLSVKGRIFDIQKFSVHDGPGIRTIVFLKGCFLRCRWCCNPESQHYETEQMTLGGKQQTVGRDVTAGEVLDEVLKDRAYFNRSGGGITLSGGECLFQPDFSASLLRGAWEQGISTAVESTGLAKFENIEKILPWLDYYLMDIKHMNAQRHKAFTGHSNELILENALKIANKARHMVIRVPVIPTFNDTPEEIAEIASFAKKLPGVTEMHLLPYHRLGIDKYEGLGRTYTLSEIVPPTQEKMDILLREVLATGLHGQIGG